MKIAVRKSGVTKAAPRLHLRKSGVTKAWARAQLRTGGALKQFYASISISLDKSLAIGRANSSGSISVASEPVTATVSGSIGALSYAWTRTAPDAQPWTIDNSTSATTSFSTTCPPDTSYGATFICTATDAAGQVIASSAVSVGCANTYFWGSGGGPYP